MNVPKTAVNWPIIEFDGIKNFFYWQPFLRPFWDTTFLARNLSGTVTSGTVIKPSPNPTPLTLTIPEVMVPEVTDQEVTVPEVVGHS